MTRSDISTTNPETSSGSTLSHDLIAGGVVFLVALPLCLGIALASGENVPLFSGLVSGIIGGIVVGAISRSHTSVSGPAAGLAAIVASQMAILGAFEAFLLAVAIAGVIQIFLGVMKAGVLSSFFPSSVIKGLLAAIGVILILKQIPHLVGHDSDPEGEMSFSQPDKENTFSELLAAAGDLHAGAALIGFASLALLIIWGRTKFLKNSVIPAPLVVVLMGVALNLLLRQFEGRWLIEASHLVQVPRAESLAEFAGFLRLPDFTQITNPDVYVAAVTIAIVASLETLLNLEAVDKIDPQQRNSRPSHELIAQGCGNIAAGMIGGLPVTSVIVRSSVNVNAGGKTKLSAVFHGVLLLVCVAIFPLYLNLIPLSALAAILLATGFKLASPQLFRQMWDDGRNQFIPFVATVLSIVLTDLLSGIIIGLVISILFILNSNLRRPIRRVVKTNFGQQVTHVELANQVSFMNRAAFDRILNEATSGTHLIIDARDTEYIDPDVQSLIRDFKTNTAEIRGIKLSLRGFTDKFNIADESKFDEYTTSELQHNVTPDQVLEILREGNRRFRTGDRLSRDFGRQVSGTADGQSPLAVVLSCIDSRVPAELVLDLGLGDIFSVRVAGNVIGTKSLGSIEFGVAVAGVKLVVVMGHTRCGAVTSSVNLIRDGLDAGDATGCQHLQAIVDEIAPCVDVTNVKHMSSLPKSQQESLIDDIAGKNVRHTVNQIMARSTVIREAEKEGRIKVVGAMYDVKSGEIEFMELESKPSQL